MKSRTAVFGLFFFFLLIKATENDDLICDGILDKKVGEDVTLGCNYTSQLDVTDKSIEWKVNKTISVLVYKSRGFSPKEQVDQFRGRASRDSSWNPAEGNLAVKISSVEITDAGVYTCSVRTGSQQTSCSTTLNIQLRAREQDLVTVSNLRLGTGNSVTDQQGNNTRTIIGGTIGGILIIGAIGAIIFFCCYFKRRPNENQVTGEEMTELRGGRGTEHV